LTFDVFCGGAGVGVVPTLACVFPPPPLPSLWQAVSRVHSARMAVVRIVRDVMRSSV
jgi:hypothetical protein